METNAERRTRKLRELAAKTEGGLRGIAAAAEVNFDSLDQVTKGVLLPPKKDGSRSPRKLGDGTAEQIEEALGLPRGWFDSDEGLPTAVDTDQAGGLTQVEGIDVPLLSVSASMGPGIDSIHEEVIVGRLTLSPQWVTKSIPNMSQSQNLRFIHGYGDSMQPTFSDGDVLLVDTGATDVRADGIYVIEANDRLYIKRVRQRMDGSFEISSDNATVKTVDVLDGSQAVRVLGRVVWVWNGKKI